MNIRGRGRYINSDCVLHSQPTRPRSHFCFLRIDNSRRSKIPVLLKLYAGVKNIHMEGTVSQISYLWLSFDFI